MTLAKLIQRLTDAAEKYGDTCEVVVNDGEGEYGFMIHAEIIDDESSETGTGVRIHLDTTGEPE